MPEMGESVTEGIVLEWHVAEGDSVSEGDTVVEVSTDKVDAEVPAPTDGVITKLIAPVDDEVPVGAPLAEMEAGRGRGSGARARTARLRVLSRGERSCGRASPPCQTPPAPRHPQRRRNGVRANGGGATSGRRPLRGGLLKPPASTLVRLAGAGPGRR